jgi:hypothetical protein
MVFSKLMEVEVVLVVLLLREQAQHVAVAQVVEEVEEALFIFLQIN